VAIQKKCYVSKEEDAAVSLTISDVIIRIYDLSLL
jgi:hypothetical protein